MNSGILLILTMVCIVLCIAGMLYSCKKNGVNAAYLAGIFVSILALVLLLNVYKSNVTSVSLFLESVQQQVNVPTTNTTPVTDGTTDAMTNNVDVTSTELE